MQPDGQQATTAWLHVERATNFSSSLHPAYIGLYLPHVFRMWGSCWRSRSGTVGISNCPSYLLTSFRTDLACVQDVGELLALKERDMPDYTSDRGAAEREAHGLPAFPEGTVQVQDPSYSLVGDEPVPEKQHWEFGAHVSWQGVRCLA